VYGEQKELKIDILPDKENEGISIKDTEIEMIKFRLISNLGAIVR
jgi:HSP90 family molecular chaperone